MLDIICLFEFSSSGSFCDDLIDPITTPYSRTIITCTDNGTSYLDPNGRLSFSGKFLEILKSSNQPGLFEDTGISHKQMVHLLQGIFSQARDNFWSSGYPFTTQPPQMVTAQGAHTLHSITLSADPWESAIPDPNNLIITEENQMVSLIPTGHYLDGLIDLNPNQVHFQSSDSQILKVNVKGEVTPNEFNGKAYILATIIDPNFTQSPYHNSNDPHLGGVTGRVPISVDIPGWNEKEGLPLAIIVAGEKEENDYLWEETHNIAQYAYLTLLARGYSKNRIYYLTHLEEELDLNSEYTTDLDGDGDPNNDIDGVPSRESLKGALDWVKEKGTDSLTIVMINHGAEGGFYLKSPANDPESLLTPQLLGQWLDELQEVENGVPQNNLTITLIIESCHSGLFIEPLKGENRVIITSTKEGKSYLYAHGLVSFTYYLFTYLQSGANLTSAYDSARYSFSEMDRFLYQNRETLNEPRQIPQIDDRSLGRTISLGSDFLLSQGQPVITSVNILPDPNTIYIDQQITIQARASDLDGIEKVWAVVNATYSPPTFTGDPDRPIVDLPTIDLTKTGDGLYEGHYEGFTYNGPYSLLVFAQDTKENVSLPYSYSINVKGDEQTRALLIAGWENNAYDFSGLLNHAQWVLEQKRFSQIKRLEQPSLWEVENALSDFDPNNTSQLLVYLIGDTQEDINQDLVFMLDHNQILSMDTLNTWLSPFSSSRQVVLLDGHEAQSFFGDYLTQPSSSRIYLWSSSSGESACLEQGGFCAFSHFFFTCLYWGANVHQALLSSFGAVQYYSYQTPYLYDGQYEELAKATYLGSPFVIKTAGPHIIVPSDQTVCGKTTLWAEVNIEDPNVWCLIKTPHQGIIHKSLLLSQDRYETTYFFDYPGMYEVITYAQDPNGLIDFGVTQYDMPEDIFEEDDFPYQATPMLINNTDYSQLHNFHDPNDVDWVIFHAYDEGNEKSYEVHVDRKGYWNYPLKAALYTFDLEPVLYNNDHFILTFSPGAPFRIIYPYVLPSRGFYLLKFFYEPGTQETSTVYEIKKITNNVAGGTSIIYGHVRHSTYHNGIGGVDIILETKDQTGETQPFETTLSGKKGAFIFLDLWEGEYQIHAEAPGYKSSPKITIQAENHSFTRLNIYLSSDAIVPAGTEDDYNEEYQVIAKGSYSDWEEKHFVSLYPGLNLFSCPCRQPECDSNCFLQGSYEIVNTFYEKINLPYEFSMSIRRYDSLHKQWQACFIDSNKSLQGEIFDLDPYEGYLVYIDIQDPNHNMKLVPFPFTCSQTDPNTHLYTLNPGKNFLGFHESYAEFNSHHLLQDPNLRDKLETIFQYNPEKGTFYPSYRIFGKPTTTPPLYFSGDKGYIFFHKGENH